MQLIIAFYFIYMGIITPFESRCLFGVHGAEGRRYNNLVPWKGREKYSQAGLCQPWGALARLPLRNATHRRQRLIVAMSIEISRNNGARQDDRIVACENIPGLCAYGCLRPEKSPLPSLRIISRNADYSCWQRRTIIPPIQYLIK